ncbi:hypothetical protein COO60DRAFT_423882 [Scenedesmus sp. NREL 46B-D3]|nr:hypothetical protein COO60DRAFT_423882 [Scenedesmus sp. NREL 46B-D3]
MMPLKLWCRHNNCCSSRDQVHTHQQRMHCFLHRSGAWPVPGVSWHMCTCWQCCVQAGVMSVAALFQHNIMLSAAHQPGTTASSLSSCALVSCKQTISALQAAYDHIHARREVVQLHRCTACMPCTASCFLAHLLTEPQAAPSCCRTWQQQILCRSCSKSAPSS